MNNKFSDKNLNCLTKENVLIFFDLQDFVLENIENVVSSYWNNLITKVPQNTKGKLIMFLSNTNYDQEQIQKSLNTINIPRSSLFRLPTINDELASLLAEIYIRYNNNLEQNQDLMEISRNIIINSQNDAGNLLKNIYDKFLDNEQTQKELSLWQKYP
jgi:chemotaxis methyl-accepting protein methylase